MKYINFKKTTVMIISIFLVTAFIYGCGEDKTGEVTEKAKEEKTTESKMESESHDMNNANMEHADIKLSSMQCGMCKKTIETAVKNTDGIQSIIVNKDEKVAHVNFDKSKTDLKNIEATITAAGYDANDKKADSRAYENLDDCCKLPNDQ